MTHYFIVFFFNEVNYFNYNSAGKLQIVVFIIQQLNYFEILFMPINVKVLQIVNLILSRTAYHSIT